MKCADALREMIAENFPEFRKENIRIGTVDISRLDGNENLCAVVPESKEILDVELDGGIITGTKFTVSMMFRGRQYGELERLAEDVADRFFRVFLDGYTLGGAVTDVELGPARYYWDCGTVGCQAAGLDLEMTIKEQSGN